MASEIIARGTHPRDKASWLSKMTLSWLNGGLKRGNKRPLQDKDLFPSLSENKMELLMANIERNWEKELITSKQQNQDPQLWKALLKTLPCKKVCWLVFLKLLRFVSAIGLPILLWLFLTDLSTDSERSLSTSLFFVISISLVTFIKGFSMQHCALRSEEWGVQLKVSCIALTYKKILYCLSRHDLQKIYTGKTINLVSNDALKMELAGLALMILSSTPFEVLATGIILWYLIGWQALTGLTLFVVLAFFIGGMSHYSGTLRDKAAAVTDKRLEVMSEIVSGIRAVKMYAWEWNFTKVVDTLRKDEMSPIRLGGLIVGSLNAFNFTAVPIAGFISVTAMVLTGIHVTAFQIFTVLSSLSIVHFTVTMAMPDLIHLITEAHVASKRIQQFLGDGFVSQLEDASPAITYKQKCERFPQLEFKGTRFSTVAFDNDESVGPFLPCLEKSGTRLKGNEFSTIAPADKDESVISTSSCFKNNETNVAASDLFSLVLRNVYCSWTKGERETLSNVSVQVRKGQMLAITGPVGAGKTSLLMTILRELPVTSGSLSCNGKIAYVPQIPWVFSGTVRDNIVFGRAFNEGKFQEIIQVCSLQKDFDSFPKKDLSQIGQRGIRLSGGQRQRVSLARALYSEADIYLLDDPLSAVDAKVGQHLFERCICGFLSDRTRLLVTHQLHYLTNLNHIVVLIEGRIAHEGSYRELHEVENVWEKVMVGQGCWDENVQKRNLATDFAVPSAVKVVQLESEDAKDLEEEEEERSIGAVTWKTYWKYLRVSLPIPMICLLVTFIITIKVVFIVPYWWASKIAEMSHDEQKAVSTLVIFGATGVAAWLIALISAWLFLTTLIRASKKLHRKMVLSVIKAPVLFFDTTPMGRILNRFSKDIGSLDKMLPLFFLDGVEVTLAAISSAIIPAVANPWLVLFVFPLLAVGVYVARYYLRSSREIKRLEAISCSPVYAHFAETLSGLEIIRSSGMEETFLKKLYEYQDVNTSALHMVVSSRRWLSIRTVSLCSVLVAATTTGALLVTQSAALAGLSLTFFLDMSQVVHYGIRAISEVENNMTSAERVMHYTELDQEPGYSCDALPPEGWPEQGNVNVQGLSLSYVEGGPRVLNNISLSIVAKEKIGVAGRTGAGKSSLVAALFRMPDPLGKVLIDDVEIGALNLQAARRSMAVITQDPVLFRGSLRRNLDPFGTFDDHQLWTVLEKVQMKNLVGTLPGRLDYQLKESGSNFSAGERQLFCLARALVQGSKIIIMDEATANVDFKTDHLIQQVIRSKFQDCTVLTIAHRLNTIIDCNKVLVLDDGQVVEFDKPEILLTKKNGLFAELVSYQNQASQGMDAIGEQKDLSDTS